MPMVVPSKDLVVEFAKIGSEIIKQVRILAISTTKLKQARDIFLPQIMNGGIVA